MTLATLLIALVLGVNGLLVATFWALAGKPAPGQPRPRRRRTPARASDQGWTPSRRQGSTLPDEVAARSGA